MSTLAALSLGLILSVSFLHHPPVSSYSHSFSTSVDGVHSRYCTSTAVGKHALLTATHCLLNGKQVISIDGKPVKVAKAIADGNDHLLLLLDGTTFKAVAPMKLNRMRVADEIEMTGNPMDSGLSYRVGVVSEIAIDADTCKHLCYFLQLPITHGDSGSGIFVDGKLVGVISATWDIDPEVNFYLTLVQGSMFTEAELKEAKNYGR